MKNSEQQGTGIENGSDGQMERSILIGLVQPRKVVHLKRWTDFFKTFPVGPNRSIQFRPKLHHYTITVVILILVTVTVVNLQMFSEISSCHIRSDGEATLATPTKAQRQLRQPRRRGGN